MLKRDLEPILKERATKIPVIAILGPRQSGKTTLAKLAFKEHSYVSLENFDARELATADPARFFKTHKNEHGIIIDEIQHAPRLLSYIQTYVDEEHRPGHVIITGSQNILVNEAISQTLAGRVSIITLLPFSIPELQKNNILPKSVEITSYQGGYPRIYAQQVKPTDWYLDYIETYVERDARQVGKIADLSIFRRFVRLCAGRIGQTVNYVSLAVDCGIDQRTAKAWLSILEASYIIFLLEPYFENFNKRVIKSPKLYFYDTGLACALLDIQSPEQLDTYYARGAIIESFMVSEICKHYYNNGERPRHVYFWKDQTHEIDCIIKKGNDLVPIEIKASNTIVADFFKGITYWNELINKKLPHGYVIYGSSQNQEWPQAQVISWQNLEDVFK
jgi:predicted AAA+ superfamily ATPase